MHTAIISITKPNRLHIIILLIHRDSDKPAGCSRWIPASRRKPSVRSTGGIHGHTAPSFRSAGRNGRRRNVHDRDGRGICPPRNRAGNPRILRRSCGGHGRKASSSLRCASFAHRPSGRGRGSRAAVNAGQVVAGCAAGIAEHPERAAGARTMKHRSNTAYGCGCRRRHLRTVALSQRLQRRTRADSDIHRHIDRGRVGDCLRHYDTIFLAVVIAAGRKVDLQIAAVNVTACGITRLGPSLPTGLQDIIFTS